MFDHTAIGLPPWHDMFSSVWQEMMSSAERVTFFLEWIHIRSSKASIDPKAKQEPQPHWSRILLIDGQYGWARRLSYSSGTGERLSVGKTLYCGNTPSYLTYPPAKSTARWTSRSEGSPAVHVDNGLELTELTMDCQSGLAVLVARLVTRTIAVFIYLREVESILHIRQVSASLATPDPMGVKSKWPLTTLSTQELPTKEYKYSERW